MGLKLLGVLFLAHVLRLVYFEQDMGGVADDVGRLIGGKEYGSGVAQPDDVAHLGCPDTAKTRVV